MNAVKTVWLSLSAHTRTGEKKSDRRKKQFENHFWHMLAPERRKMNAVKRLRKSVSAHARTGKKKNERRKKQLGNHFWHMLR